MKTKHRKRTPRIFLSALLTLVLAISIAAPLQALAAGDDVFYMSVSGTLRYDYANEVASLTNQQRAASAGPGADGAGHAARPGNQPHL